LHYALQCGRTEVTQPHPAGSSYERGDAHTTAEIIAVKLMESPGFKPSIRDKARIPVVRLICLVAFDRFDES
jgi:hypothetical protein